MFDEGDGLFSICVAEQTIYSCFNVSGELKAQKMGVPMFCEFVPCDKMVDYLLVDYCDRDGPLDEGNRVYVSYNGEDFEKFVRDLQVRLTMRGYWETELEELREGGRRLCWRKSSEISDSSA